MASSTTGMPQPAWAIVVACRCLPPAAAAAAVRAPAHTSPPHHATSVRTGGPLMPACAWSGCSPVLAAAGPAWRTPPAASQRPPGSRWQRSGLQFRTAASSDRRLVPNYILLSTSVVQTPISPGKPAPRVCYLAPQACRPRHRTLWAKQIIPQQPGMHAARRGQQALPAAIGGSSSGGGRDGCRQEEPPARTQQGQTAISG